MAATSLGLVGIVDKGDYNSATTYVKGNFVYYNYCSWLCKVASATGIEPTEQNNTTWQLLAKGINLATFTGATASTAGTGGAVPAPQAGDEGKALMGDGTWDYAGELSWTGTQAQWDALSASEKAEYDGKKVYITDDYMENIPVMIGASANDGGYKGLVPTPNAGDENKVLMGNGAWSDKVYILIKYGNWRTGIREKNLGNSFTADQQSALAAGDFSEFWNGDYWVINGVTWRIVDNTQPQKNRGDTNFTTPHLVIFPDSLLVSAEAYLIDGGTSSSNTDTHGYANCGYRTDEKANKGRTQCKNLFKNAFGASHIATHRELMSTSRGTGGATGWDWQDADVELPTEENIYGHGVWGAGKADDAYVSGWNVGSQWGQWMLYKLCPTMALSRINYWLRNIRSASYFARVSYGGSAYFDTPSVPYVGLRPYALLV